MKKNGQSRLMTHHGVLYGMSEYAANEARPKMPSQRISRLCAGEAAKNPMLHTRSHAPSDVRVASFRCGLRKSCALLVWSPIASPKIPAATNSAPARITAVASSGERRSDKMGAATRPSSAGHS